MYSYFIEFYKFHSSGSPEFKIYYIHSKDKYYIKGCLNIIQAYVYSKYEILDLIKFKHPIDFYGNSTHQRRCLSICKNEIDIYNMDLELNGGCYYSIQKGEEQFRNDLCKCIGYCMDLLKEIQINQHMPHPINIIKKCNISGAQTNINISVINYNDNICYIIENDMYEPLMFIKNKELLKNFIKYQMRYTRYLETKNFLTNKDDYKDYYQLHGHDSDRLLNDSYNYLVEN